MTNDKCTADSIINVINKLFNFSFDSVEIMKINAQYERLLFEIETTRKLTKNNKYFGSLYNKIKNQSEIFTKRNKTLEDYKNLQYTDWCLFCNCDSNNLQFSKKQFLEYKYFLKCDYDMILNTKNYDTWFEREKSNLPKHIKRYKEFKIHLKYITEDIRDYKKFNNNETITESNLPEYKKFKANEFRFTDEYFSEEDQKILNKSYDDIYTLNLSEIVLLDENKNMNRITQLKNDKILDSWLKLLHPDKTKLKDKKVAALLLNKTLYYRRTF